MKAEIISIGDELLIGQTINTNASWMGEQLAEKSIVVQHVQTIRDDEDSILEAFDDALKRAEIVFVTGGLGPTKDDITKLTLCKYFDTELELNAEIHEHVKFLFESKGKHMLDVNDQQAMLPKSCVVLKNEIGTASGMWFEKEGKILVSLPGVPYEMQHIFITQVMPVVEKRFHLKSIFFETLNFQGIGESYLADKITIIEDAIREEGIGLAYLPSPGSLRLRLTCVKEQDKINRVKYYVKVLEDLLPEYAFSKGKQQLREVIGVLLKENKQTIATVESCTGGSLAGEITKVPGSSGYYQGSLICYDNRLKILLADVSNDSLMEFGAVSKQVVEQMALNGRKKLNVDYCIATSGIAGPDGGSAEKPVGTVWIAIAHPDGVFSRKYLFTNDRDRNIKITVLTALNLLRRIMLGIKFEKS